jgi:SAM-dependent methyltransferase
MASDSCADPRDRIRTISALSPDDASFDISCDRDIAALLEAEDRHFWHWTRNRIIRQRLDHLGVRAGAQFLELGCGAGCVASALATAGLHVTGVDGHRQLLEVAARRNHRLALWLHDLRRGTDDLPRGDFDAVGLFDVIEHLDDPVVALEDAARLVRPAGLLVGTVPALMSLWSEIDARAGHKTRYSVRTLSLVLGRVRTAATLEIIPFNRILVPMIWAQRRLFSRRASAEHILAVPPWPLNGLLAAMVMAEQGLARLLDRTPLAGASLWFAMRVAAAR